MKTHGSAVIALVLALIASPVHAGNVLVTYSRGTLTLAGGDDDDAVTITAPAADSVQVTPVTPTTVNGSADPQSFGAIGDLVVALGLGTNALTVNGIAVEKSVTMKGGAGDDTLALDGSTIGKTVSAQLGAGTNALTFVNGAIGGALKYKGGAGADDVLLAGSTVAAKATLALGAGANTAALTAVTVDSLAYSGGGDGDSVGLTLVAASKGKVSIATGAGENHVAMDRLSVATDFAYKGGADLDDFSVVGLVVGDAVSVTAGAGVNAIALYGPSIGGTVAYRGGSGNDHVAFGITDAPGNVSADLGGGVNLFETILGDVGALTVKGGADVDNAVLLRTHVLKHVKLALGDGNNGATLDQSTVDGNFTIKTGPGDDALTFTPGTVVQGAQKIDLGDGTNTIVAP
jgi:hypothetical protein